MARKARARLRALVDELARTHPELDDPREAIAAGSVLVNGVVRMNPDSLVRVGSVTLGREHRLRGEAKLGAALAAFSVSIAGRTALDVGAAAGGFTRVLLAAGATRVYAVDAGHGQLLGSLRQDARVVNLERTNVGELDATLVPDVIDVVTVDLSYLALHDAVPQLNALVFSCEAHLIALVKPQFELELARLPKSDEDLNDAVRRAREGLAQSGWRVRGAVRSPVKGAGGAIEFLVHATRISSRR